MTLESYTCHGDLGIVDAVADVVMVDAPRCCFNTAHLGNQMPQASAVHYITESASPIKMGGLPQQLSLGGAYPPPEITQKWKACTLIASGTSVKSKCTSSNENANSVKI